VSITGEKSETNWHDLESHWWWDLASPDFATLDPERTVAILPVGAVEQHGPHLPVRVDSAINAGIIARAIELMPAGLPGAGAGEMPSQVRPSTSRFPHPDAVLRNLARVWYEIARASIARTSQNPVLQFPWRPAQCDSASSAATCG